MKELCKFLYGDKVGIEEYDSVKAVPLRYVAQAQLIEEEQEMYEELWAVFDKNGHSHHKEAFERAVHEVNNKKVHIGFDDPAEAEGAEAFILSEFVRIRDEIKRDFRKFYDSIA